MPITDLPPLGWPHTEAKKARRKRGPGHTLGEPPPPPRDTRSSAPQTGSRRGCGCAGPVTLVVGVLAALFAAGVAATVLFLTLGNQTDSGASAADAFLAGHPDWEVESSDLYDAQSGTVRLVAWDYGRGVGRLVFMQPDESSTVYAGDSWNGPWIEYPLIEDLAGDTYAEESFLDAFAEPWSQVEWTYVRNVEPVDLVSDPEVWTAYYRLWDPSMDAWTDVRSAAVTRDRDSGSWSAGPVDDTEDPPTDDE